ncbi:MAG: HAMP domain-containing sensor histidine kinase [Acidimicrobiia bacterium]
MTLRARLVLSITGLMVVMVLALGAVAVRSAERVLLAEIDAGLVEVADRGRLGGPLGDLLGGRSPLRQTYALVAVGPTGRTLAEIPSGFEGDPDPLPDVTDLSTTDRNRLVTLPATEGDLEYRALVAAGPRGSTIVLAEPLRLVTAATTRLLRLTVAGGLVVLGLGATATWWTVRRETRTIDGMVAAARDVAAGDLSRRVTEEPSAAELTELRNALNEMFRRNEQAFATERATKDRLRRFVADASHELRTPITAISGYAQLHRMGGLEDPGDRAAAMTRIETETARMEGLIDDLMLLARLDREPELLHERVVLAPVLEATVADHRAISSDHPADLEVDPGLAVSANPGAITQVVANLLTNVRAHTPAGTAVRVSAHRVGDDVVIAVSDDGPGVDDEHLPRLFDRFYQAEDPMRRSGPGSGLGLAIVAGLVESMGGSVAAATPPAGGLAVSVRLRSADNGEHTPSPDDTAAFDTPATS